MVNGCLTSQHYAKVTVVDLDGTLVRCNTLKVFFRKGIRKLITERKFKPLVTLLILISARKLHLISHHTMKFRGIEAIGASTSFLQLFGQEIQLFINNDVVDFIKKRECAGDTILLATAAADIYVPYIWDGLSISSSACGDELQGKAKTLALNSWLKQHGASITYFLTDHVSDLPTALYTRKNGGTTILVSPTERSRKQFATHNITSIL